MKSIKTYILEQLSSEFLDWFKKLYANMIKLQRSNSLESVDIDITKLSKPKTEAYSYEDFLTDKYVKSFLSNPKYGFTVINQMVKNPKKYFPEQENDDKEVSNCKCLPYWYKTDNYIYFVGLIIYDTGIKHIDNCCNILAIESSLIVKDSYKLLKAMLNDFCNNYINKENKFVGLTAKPTHPKTKAIVTKLNFKSSKDNKEILVYKI